ncbi:hypothetical protein CHS0354_032966 [Potamilus streckersoni]|uniref:G-protein coupled receptors family 1 profile domain-containing protein n=1 Tax=Potamilus streckersoni TaxID=2493646 RepID=A0AAE0RXP6_9BIVA|nr:hypothetical protein CHS0354_032966 [Potamilus streckersoni]
MELAPIHANVSNESIHVALGGGDLYYFKYQFLNSHPHIVLPCLVILVVASVVGTAGNILILLAVARTKELRNVESFFIVNMACSDLYVTLIADPMNIVDYLITV